MSYVDGQQEESPNAEPMQIAWHMANRLTYAPGSHLSHVCLHAAASLANLRVSDVAQPGAFLKQTYAAGVQEANSDAPGSTGSTGVPE